MNTVQPFYGAAGVCAPEIKKCLYMADKRIMEETAEIRLRNDRPVVLYGKYGSSLITPSGELTNDPEGCLYSSCAAVSDTFNRLCGYSIHSHQNSIVNGYITVMGGHRAGIAGTAVRDSDGKIQSVRNISCINIRIARECHTAAREFMKMVFDDGVKSVIIAGPPSSGKTTMLRDIARRISGVGEKSCKVTVIDEREELAAVYDGVSRFDVGINTDVLDSYPKGAAISAAIRTMSPDVIICDEVSEPGELCAISAGANAGVKFILSVHASDYKELIRRKQIEQLLSTYGFEKVVLLKGGSLCEIQEIYDAGEIRDEIYRDRACGGIVDPDGSVFGADAENKIEYG
ncbi:MAG: Flp pilus assembly complex ATPase component TadA [Clostridia bacterium]|nr:Flp pilus assembly complex ATPase component TadA [Clostridia bacterium]